MRVRQYIPFYQDYGNPIMFNTPNVFDCMKTFTPIFTNNNNFFTGSYQSDFNLSWQNNSCSMPRVYTPNKTTKTKPSLSNKKETTNNYTYNNEKDIYATQNSQKIKQLNNEMQERTKKLIAYANLNGYDVEITSGYRSQEEQDRLIKKYTELGQPNRAAKISAHTSRKAIDIRVYKNGKRCEAGYDLLGKYAVDNLGMRWGGNFKSVVEKWHFDYDWVTT